MRRDPVASGRSRAAPRRPLCAPPRDDGRLRRPLRLGGPPADRLHRVAGDERSLEVAHGVVDLAVGPAGARLHPARRSTQRHHRGERRPDGSRGSAPGPGAPLPGRLGLSGRRQPRHRRRPRRPGSRSRHAGRGVPRLDPGPRGRAARLLGARRVPSRDALALCRPGRGLRVDHRVVCPGARRGPGRPRGGADGGHAAGGADRADGGALRARAARRRGARRGRRDLGAGHLPLAPGPAHDSHGRAAHPRRVRCPRPTRARGAPPIARRLRTARRRLPDPWNHPAPAGATG
jgi:hypothetical protein